MDQATSNIEVVAEKTHTLAGRYVLLERIASGGMATVWSARDDVLARAVAVKLLHHHLARDEQFVHRFKREALAAARLAHPNIVSIYDSGSQPNDREQDHFIVMEYCGGGTLAKLLQDSGAVAPDHAVALTTTVLDALAYAHRAGIIHRDIKPANVLMSEDGTVKVGDFGIAKAAFAGSDLTTTGSILGTVTYLAPEQLEGMEPDARSDIYSVGVLLYELLSGRPPFVGENQLATALKHQRETPPPLRSLRAGIPRGLESIVARALEKDPDRRFASAAEMRSALERQASTPATQVFGAPPVRASEDLEEAAARTGPGVRWLAPVLALIALGLALVLGLPWLIDNRVTGDTPQGQGPAGDGDATGPQRLQVRSTTDFDPHGGDGEHPEEAHLAADGDRSTVWRTSTYHSSLEALGKPGVGLLFDLGQEREVSRVRIWTQTPGLALELRAGQQPGGDESSLEVVGRVSDAAQASVVRPQGGGRYWLVWITSLPDAGGGSARIAEVEFFGA